MHPNSRLFVFRITRDWQAAGPGIKRALFCLVASLIPCLILYIGLSEAIEPPLLRLWFSIRGQRETPHSVTIVRLDKPAYAKVGRSPREMYPRRYLAEGIEKITSAGARLIVFDGFFDRDGDDAEGDDLLERALAASPIAIGRYTEEIVDTMADGSQKQKRLLVKPINRFARSAKAVIPLEFRLTNGVVREICLSNVRDFLSDVDVPVLEPLRKYVASDIQKPGGFDFINFYGGPSTLTSLSFVELLGSTNKNLNDYFRDRVVLIGIVSDTATGLTDRKDTFITSVSNVPMYGVEIHATIVANLVDGTWIRRIGPQAEGVMLGLAAFVSAFGLMSVGALGALILGITIATGWLVFSYFCFSSFLYFIPSVSLCVIIIPILVIIRWGMLAFSSINKL